MFDKTKMIKIKNSKLQKKSKLSKEEYVESYIYDNNEKYIVHVGIDDYGQSYFLRYTLGDKDYEIGCGTYNFNYIFDIEYIFEKIFKV